MHVHLRDLHRAVLLVDTLAELADPAEFADVALPGLAALIGCDLLSYNEIGPAGGRVFYADYPPGVLNAMDGAVFTAHVHEHPLVSYYRASGTNEPVMISDFLSQAELHRTGLYAEYFRHLAVEHQIAVRLPGAGDQVIGIALSRSRPDFSEVDRDLLGVLRRPLMTALLRAGARHRAESALRADAGALSALTDREVRILQLVARGRTNVAVARGLDISPRTVAKHLEHIYRKLGVSSRAHAVSRAGIS
jgi:DNA-binding CsgD family transcriptional regulator